MAEDYEVIPLSPLRKVIAARMSEAKRTVPHFRLIADLSVEALVKLREGLRKDQPDAAVSFNDLLVKACAFALVEVPAVNLQWVDGEIRRYRTVDISVVTAIDGGLSTPIVRDVASKPIRQIAREIRELTVRAASNTLKVNEVFGGSFSISNLGMHGIEQFDAIINLPQCAILAVGRARPCPVVMRDGSVGVRNTVRVTLSVDHRAIDGATGAKFLAALQSVVEQPEQLLNS